MKSIRNIARLTTLFIPNQEKRKTARLKVENFLHKLFKTEYYECSTIFNERYRQNRAIGFEKYHLISLGQNCFVRMTMSDWGLKARKADGEKTMPFDISVHPLKTMIKMLKTHFNGYFDNLEYDNEKQCWINSQLGIEFLHDHETDKNIFIERYHNRIAALDEALQDKKPCLFFAYQDKETQAADINELYDILAKLCAHKNFKLVYMVFNHPLPQGINSAVATYQADYPEGYRHMDKYTKFEHAGLSFEKPVVEFTRAQLLELLKEKA